MDMIIRFLADGLMVLIALLAGYSLLFRVHRKNVYDTYARIFMAGISSYWVAKMVATLWQPAALRPFELMGSEAGASYLNNPGFPSDHALFATFLTLAVWYATRNRTLVGTMATLTVLVCVGRVLALVHTPLDIAGGVIVAGIGALWYIDGIPKFRRKLVKKSRK